MSETYCRRDSLACMLRRLFRPAIDNHASPHMSCCDPAGPMDTMLRQLPCLDDKTIDGYATWGRHETGCIMLALPGPMQTQLKLVRSTDAKRYTYNQAIEGHQVAAILLS